MDTKVQMPRARIEIDEKNLGNISSADPQVGSRVKIVLYGTVIKTGEEMTNRLDDVATKAVLEIDVQDVYAFSNNDIQELFDPDRDG
jgi:hypothetical protein